MILILAALAQDRVACERFEQLGLRDECVTATYKLEWPAPEVVGSCVEGFGPTKDALRCIHAVADSETKPFDDIRACTTHLKTSSDRLGCIQRFRSIPWDAEPAARACASWSDPEACLAAFAGTALFRKDKVPMAEAIDACEQSLSDGKKRLGCLKADSEIALACTRIESEALVLECLGRLPGVKPAPAPSMNGCIDLVGTGVDALRCLTAIEQATTDPQPDFAACKILEPPRERVKCMARFSEIGWEARVAVERCRAFSNTEACLAAIGQGGDVAPNLDGILPCHEAFGADEDLAVKCVRSTREADPTFAKRLEACADIPKLSKRWSCVQK